MLITRWPGWFKDLYGGNLPEEYMAVDVETTGFDKNKDVIVEIGHVLVRGGKVSSSLNLILNWAGHRVVREGYVRNKLESVKKSMNQAGKSWSLTWEKMTSEGMRPERAMDFYRELLADWSSQGGFFVLHNGFFDEDMLAYNFAGFGVDPDGFDFPDNQYFDTAAIERGNQLPGDPACLPQKGETMKKYFKRLKYIGGSKLHSSLDDHCLKKYGLADGLDASQCHTSMFDSLLTHRLMEKFRAGSAAARQLEPPRPPARPPASPARRRGQRNR